MNNTRKQQLLYQKAHGQEISATPAEQRELRKYKVNAGDGNYATKANIRDYIKAVDGGYPLSFYDWCMNHHKADRRRRGSSKREMASENREKTLAAMLLGWLVWGVAIYWIANQTLPVKTCAIAGAVVAAVLSRVNRRLAFFTLFILPCIITAVVGHFRLG